MLVNDILTQCRPAVSKSWLYFVAGFLWTAVGIMLLNLAVGWLKPVGTAGALPFALAGFVLALAFYFFTFSKLVCRNLGRIEDLHGEKSCIFAFQTWKSYPLILFMIVLGVMLRHYLPVPKPFLAILYAGVGGGLFLSSLRYYGRVLSGPMSNDGS
jgi:hypothetical protein